MRTPAPISAERLADSLKYAQRRAQLERVEYEGELDLASTLEDLLAHIDALAAALKEAEQERNEARARAKYLLEEAAKICDGYDPKDTDHVAVHSFALATKHCAKEIRAIAQLKGESRE